MYVVFVSDTNGDVEGSLEEDSSSNENIKDSKDERIDGEQNGAQTHPGNEHR